MIGLGMLGMTLGGWSVSAAAWAFEVSIKAAIVVGIALFLCAVLRRAAAAVRAGVLAAALLSLLVLPLLPMLLPGWSFPRLSGPPRFSEVVMETGSEWADSGDQSEPLSLVSEPVVSEAADDGSRGEAARETGRGLGSSMEGPVLGVIFWAMGAAFGWYAWFGGIGAWRGCFGMGNRWKPSGVQRCWPSLERPIQVCSACDWLSWGQVPFRRRGVYFGL